MAESSEIITQTNLPLPLFRRGKVRDTYELDSHLLMISTDRISAFDVVLPHPISGKGRVLNLLSAFWLGKTAHIVPNHIIAVVDSLKILKKYSGRKDLPVYLVGRSMIVKKAVRIPVECVVRGYLAGSAWAEYQRAGNVQGIPLPAGLQESQELPQLLFTPTTKAESGHDQPLTAEGLKALVGDALALELRRFSLLVYTFAREYAAQRDIIIADTKMEFGLSEGKLILIDELLTPDSSRFWDARLYQMGRPQPSLDKQPLRDWLLSTGWNQEPPAPLLPADVIQATAQRYREAYRRITGRRL